MHHGTPDQSAMIRGAIEQGNGRHLLDAVLETMATCGSLEWTQKRAEEEADKAIAALQILPDTPWRDALIGLLQSSAIINPPSFPARRAGKFQ